MRRHRLTIAAVILLIGFALLLLRRRHASVAAAEWVADASPGSTPLGQPRHLRFVKGVPKRAAQSAEAARASADAGQAALSIKIVRSLFDVSALLHRNAIEAAQNVDRYCAEAAQLPKPLASPPPVEPDDPSTQERDAAYFLLPRVSWETRPRTVGTLALPAVRPRGSGPRRALAHALDAHVARGRSG